MARGNGNSIDPVDGSPIELRSDPSGFGYPAIEPTELRADPGGGDSGPERRKRRGRPPGSTNRSRTEAAKAFPVDAWAKTLIMVHAGAAAFMQFPEFALEKDEADLLATSMRDVAIAYDIVPDPKTQALIGMVMAIGTVYGPRAYLALHRKQSTDAAARPNLQVVQ